MTLDELDGLLWRAENCPNTLTLEQLRAAERACEERGIEVPERLIIARVTRIIEGAAGT